ncbi:MAG: amidase [Gammaproteobacteria bacterium]
MNRPYRDDNDSVTGDPCHAPAITMAHRIRNREISAVELVEHHLERLDEVNLLLNAVVTRCDDSALEKAEAADAAISRGAMTGPLHGVPFTIKDGFDTAEVRTTAATEGWAERVPSANATVVQRVLDAGAILIGKTNTPELTLSYDTDNLLFGRSYNPYDPSCSPGGSSGGGAAIVAAGGAAFDIGSDTGGSIRLPAHFCGIAAIKPSAGLVPRTGLVVPGGTPIDSLTQVGPRTRSVADLQLILPLIAGPDWRDCSILPSAPISVQPDAIRKSRVAFYCDNGDLAASDEIAAAVRNCAGVLADIGAEVTETRPEGIESARALFGRVFGIDGGAWIRRLLAAVGTRNKSPALDWTDTRIDRPVASAGDFSEMLAELDRFRSRMLAFMRNFDLILAPVHAYAALPHNLLNSADLRPAFSYTQAFNLTGWPSAVVRTGTTDRGLPVGIQIVAAPWQDPLTLEVAALLEASLGGWRAPMQADEF